jgi:outer membrane protein OmpA-like peptidoglycan-associated protein
MQLSMNRAYNVAQFIFDISKGKPYYKDLTHIIRVEGASFSRPILVEGKEHYTKSRRVELRLVLKEQKLEVLHQFLRQGTGAHYEKL